ncbi:MAG TPA: hypothetical protein VMR52_04215 [Dehalococcoidia bacterium]|nr:hypothetical protein [Dehalococcoidia bacterium]
MSQQVLHRPHAAAEATGQAAAIRPLVIAAVAGMLAGMMMAMFSMVVAEIDGYGFWAPPRAITAVFFGAENLGSGFEADAVIGGVAIHMVLSMMFGIGFALMLAPRQKVNAVVQVMIGMALGTVLWAVNTYVVAPVFEGNLFDEAMADWTWIAAHVIFGAALAMIYAFWRPGRTSIEPRI